MRQIRIIKHGFGAPLFRSFGLGPSFTPVRAIKQLKELLHKNSTWAKDRKVSDLREMISKSNSIVTMWDKRKLIGFGRRTSDSIYRAVLWDVLIEQKYQKQGLGMQLIESLLSCKSIRKVEKVYLMTTNCENFYKNYDFKTNTSQVLMFREAKVNEFNLSKVNNISS